MLIYEIPYNRDKKPNSMTDFLQYIIQIEDPLTEICFFLISHLKDSSTKKYFTPDFCYILFNEKYLDYFSTLLSVYEAKRLNELPSFDTATILSGNANLLKG